MCCMNEVVMGNSTHAMKPVLVWLGVMCVGMSWCWDDDVVGGWYSVLVGCAMVETCMGPLLMIGRT